MKKIYVAILAAIVLFSFILVGCDEVVHVHEFSSTYSFDETHHWRSCSCGERTDYATHLFASAVVEEAAGITTAGRGTQTCQVCGYTRTVEIPATYRCTVDFVDPEGVSIASKVVEYNSTVKPPADTVPAVKRWLDANGDEFDFSGKITGNTTITASYLANCRVRFYSDGVLVSEQSVLENGKADEVEKPTKKGHAFDGWVVSGTGDAFSLDSVITGDIDLEASWKETCTVTFVTGFGADNTYVTVVKGETLPEPDENPGDSFAGYRFFWWSSRQGGEAFDFNGTAIENDTTLYAVYRELYLITFNDRGNITTQSIAYNDIVNSIEVTPQDGYVLDYWSRDRNNNYGTQVVEFPHTVTGAETFYANWRKIVDVNFNRTDPETGAVKSTSIIEAMEGHTFSSMILEESGFAFAGWTLDPAVGETYDFSTLAGTDDIDLYSVWDRNYYNVSL